MPRPAMVSWFVLAAVAHGQTPQWRMLSAVNPNPFSGSEIAYDHLRDRAIVYGGMTGHLPVSALNEFDGDTWLYPTYGSSAIPPARAGHKLAFDGSRGETLLVGGGVLGPTFFTDTWVWNGSVWVERFPQNPPPPAYADFTLTYDDEREVVVLYSGQALHEWNGIDWLLRTPAQSPPVRRYHSAAYDSRQHRMLVHGGAVGSSFQLTDTWAWDGNVWQQLASSGPFTNYNTQMVFDRERGVGVLVGFGSCHEFDGVTWTAQSAPPSLGMVSWDRQRNRVVMVFGWNGQSTPAPGSTWVYEIPGLAVAQPYGIGCGNPALVAREDPNARPVVGGTLGVDIEQSPTGVAFMCFGWSNDLALGLALPQPMDSWGLPGCWLLQSDDAITLPCATTGATTARFTFALPNSPTFAGLPFFLQPWAPAPGLNPAGVAIGNAIAVTIGSF
ncbi:MAG: hypothetical protein KDE27_19365 [Planctomycetes bacterium]|nr:hypothetical protein [Planctomycetota bacterium]